MAKKQHKLELTWFGKGNEPKLEPRILIENNEYSYGDSNSSNMLIHGDNLLALKALEQDFSGIVKCVYIDPPFNTGAAFDHYEDGVEHSIWLDLMHNRIKILFDLLSKDGSIFIHLDDNESDYCKLLLDEVFGRDNFINRITIDARSPSAFSTVNPGVFKSSEYILWYAKDKRIWESRSMRIKAQRSSAYNKYIKNRNLDHSKWKLISLKLAFLENLNTNKLESLNKITETIFVERDKFIDKALLYQFLIDEFPYDQIVDLKKLATYLFGKLKSENYFENFFAKVYPYLLERTSYNYKESDIDNFVFDNAQAVYRETEISDSGAGKETVELKYESIKQANKILLQKREGTLDDIYVLNGKQISFYAKNVLELDGEKTATKLLTNIWTDISWEGIANEGNVKFKKGKKPEKLIQRCLELTTNEGDIVLDSFLGSGTTAAVAHKMGRKWIGIELGDHVNSHCFPRLKKIVAGKDVTGISNNCNWEGGGGFKFYNLAPSLLNLDSFGNWIISKEYNPTMVAAAIAKQEGFRYHPDGHIYWKQGKSSEKDYIYSTTQFITVEMLDKIEDEMQSGESLLIACKAFQAECNKRHSNISIKKIPQMLLGKCEFGKEDYSFNIVNIPKDDSDNTEEYIEEVKEPEKKHTTKQITLNFTDQDE